MILTFKFNMKSFNKMFCDRKTEKITVRNNLSNIIAGKFLRIIEKSALCVKDRKKYV